MAGATLGAVGLLGHILGLNVLTTIVPGQPAMMPNTALGLVLIGSAGALATIAIARTSAQDAVRHGRLHRARHRHRDAGGVRARRQSAHRSTAACPGHWTCPGTPLTADGAGAHIPCRCDPPQRRPRDCVCASVGMAGVLRQRNGADGPHGIRLRRRTAVSIEQCTRHRGRCADGDRVCS